MTRYCPTLIVEPVYLFREGLRRILQEHGFQPVWCSDSPPVGPVATLTPDAPALLIIGSEFEEAILQIAAIKSRYPSCRTVLMVDPYTAADTARILRIGADTVVTRRSSPESLIKTLELVMDGASIFPSDVVHGLAAPFSIVRIPTHDAPPAALAGAGSPADDAAKAMLSEREFSVLRLLVLGMPNKLIARELGIMEATVKVHVKAILRKTKASNRTQVAFWASRVGIGGADSAVGA